MRRYKNIIAAFQFLTSIPLPIKTGDDHLKHSTVWYPVVGAVIGVTTGFGFQLFRHFFDANISAVITIFIYIILTRGLHLDGFMDTIDGFFSYREKSAVLKIMKDPTVGSFAVLGIGTWFLVLFNAIPPLEPLDHIVIHSFTRLSILPLPLIFSYPRDSGTGKFFVKSTKKKTVFLAVGITLLMLALFYLFRVPLLQLVVYSAFMLISFFVSLAIGLWSKKRIGGISGDTLGFTIETIHLVLILLIPLRFKYM